MTSAQTDTLEHKALRALRSRDFETAAKLLRDLVEANGYASDAINNAYTLALYKTGRQAELSDAAFQIGVRRVENEPALAMDYFQRAMLAGLSADRVRTVGKIFEQRAVPRNRDRYQGRAIGADRVAHVIGCLLPGHAPSLYVQILSKALKERGVRSYVFTTEWASSWFFNPPGAPQSQPIEIEAETIIASVEGDFLQRAERIARAIRDSGIDIVLYHCSLTEQITSQVAALRPARIQLNVNHAEEADADLFEGFVHLFENGAGRTRFGSRPWRWIPLISDIEERLADYPPATRESLGVESAETVSGTFGNLYKVSGEAYLRTLAEILRRFPQNVHLFAGSGDDGPVRKFLDDAGILSRVRFLGHIPDVAPLLGAIDVYLNSFPHSGGQSVLEPMAAGKPVVVRRFKETSHYNVGSELAGLPEIIGTSDDEYVAIADRLFRDADLRRECGQRLNDRFRKHFTPQKLAQQYLDFFHGLAL